MSIRSANPTGSVFCSDLTPTKKSLAIKDNLARVPGNANVSRFPSVSKKPISKPRSRLFWQRSTVVKKRFVGFHDMPSDAQRAIASRMGIAELYAARLAGLGLSSSSNNSSKDDKVSKDVLQEHFFRKVQAVRPLWECWVNHSHRRARRKREALTPMEFVTKVQSLFIPSATPEILTSIVELPNLLELDLSRESTWRASPLDELPDALATCARLRVLKLSRACFQSLPPCVLRLRRLRKLHVDLNTQLMGLPADIGIQLKQLTTINISGCANVKELPPSLLETLESNLTKLHMRPPVNRKTKKGCAPLLLSREHFEDGYLDRILNVTDYPMLVHALHHAYNPADVEQAPEQPI